MRITLTSIHVEDQDLALCFYTEVLGFVKKTEVQEPVDMGSVTTAVFDDTCGNLIQIAQVG